MRKLSQLNHTEKEERNWQVSGFKDSEENTSVKETIVCHTKFTSLMIIQQQKDTQQEKIFKCHKPKRWEMYLRSPSVSM